MDYGNAFSYYVLLCIVADAAFDAEYRIDSNWSHSFADRIFWRYAVCGTSDLCRYPAGTGRYVHIQHNGVGMPLGDTGSIINAVDSLYGYQRCLGSDESRA